MADARRTGTVTYCPTVKRNLQCRSDEVEILVEP